MNKRSKAMYLSLSLWRFANQMDEMEKEYINRSKALGATRYTFWHYSGPINFKTTSEIRSLARKIARESK